MSYHLNKYHGYLKLIIIYQEILFLIELKQVFMQCKYFLHLLPVFFIFTNINAQTLTDTPEIFMQDLISTGLNERDLAISPDGKTIYFTIVGPQNVSSSIFFIEKLKNGTWSKPKTASFSGIFQDLEPTFSPDGKRIYFASKRPVNGKDKKDFDLWYVEKNTSRWSDPKHLDFCTEKDEFYPSVTQNGSIYFTSSYNEEVSKEDIYFVSFENDKYTSPIALDSAINTNVYEFNSYVAPDESFLIFTAYGRKGDKGRGDLYLSKKVNGKWQPSRPITKINSDKLDYCPVVSSDQKILYFTSERTNLKSMESGKKLNYDDFEKFQYSSGNGLGDIYWVSFKEIEEHGVKN